MENGWNPWHGCHKISPGCKNCYVYRIDECHGRDDSMEVRKTRSFDLPVKKKRDGSWKIVPGTEIYTCFTSDFLVEEADEWRPECWRMMRERSDCTFIFFTKRIDRLVSLLPDDWGDGYANVVIGCSVENNAMANFRLPIFNSLPIKHKLIIAAPLLESVNLTPYLNDSIDEVSVGGESGIDARLCDYNWVLDIRRQCMEKNVPFTFHQTGANFRKNGRVYHIDRKLQHSQAKKAGINTGKISENRKKFEKSTI